MERRAAPRAMRGNSRLAWGAGASFPVVSSSSSLAVRTMAYSFGSAVPGPFPPHSHTLPNFPGME